MKLDFKLVSSQHDFISLQRVWDVLNTCNKSCVFSSYHWCKMQFVLQKKPLIITAWNQGDCIAILPLALKEKCAMLGIGQIVHLCSFFSDYQRFLYSTDFDPGTLLRECLDYLSKRGLGHNSILLTSPSKELSLLVSEFKCSVSVTKSNKQFLRTYNSDGDKLSSKVMREARRRRNRLYSRTNIEFNTLQGYDKSLVDFILEQNRLNYGENTLNSWRFREHALLLFNSVQDRLILFFLKNKDNGNYVAGAICFMVSGKIYYYLASYDKSYQAFSPGIVLLYELITSKTRSYTHLEFLRGEESYKADWSNSYSTSSALLLQLETMPSWKRLVDQMLFRRLYPSESQESYH